MCNPGQLILPLDRDLSVFERIPNGIEGFRVSQNPVFLSSNPSVFVVFVFLLLVFSERKTRDVEAAEIF